MSNRSIYNLIIYVFFILAYHPASKAQLIGIELEPGRIDTLQNIISSGSFINFTLCQGGCYQFYYLKNPNRNDRFDYFEDSIYWTFNLGIPRKSRERNPYVCFPEIGGPDTISMFQLTFNKNRKEFFFAGFGYQRTFIVRCKPIADFNADRFVVCVGNSVTFLDESRFLPDEWYWTFEGGEPSVYEGRDPPPIRYDTPGIYTARLQVRNLSGADEMERSSLIEVRPGPQMIDEPVTDLRADFGSSVGFTPCSIGDIYTWSPADGLSCVDCPYPELQVGHTDRYMLTVAIEGQDCIDTCIYQISAQPVNESIWFPSAFTPNGDGINDHFGGYGQYIEIEELRIYDRWGSELYKGKGAEANWDGRASGRFVDPGSYAFYAIYRKLYTQETDIISGEVSVFR